MTISDWKKQSTLAGLTDEDWSRISAIAERLPSGEEQELAEKLEHVGAIVREASGRDEEMLGELEDVVAAEEMILRGHEEHAEDEEREQKLRTIREAIDHSDPSPHGA